MRSKSRVTRWWFTDNTSPHKLLFLIWASMAINDGMFATAALLIVIGVCIEFAAGQYD